MLSPVASGPCRSRISAVDRLTGHLQDLMNQVDDLRSKSAGSDAEDAANAAYRALLEVCWDVAGVRLTMAELSLQREALGRALARQLGPFPAPCSSAA